jgi:hypothetical protein
MIRPYYSAALGRLNPEAQRIRPESNRDWVDGLVKYFSPAGNFIEPAGAHSLLGSDAVEFEAWAYWLNWRLPLVLCLPVLASGAIACRRRWAAVSRTNNNARDSGGGTCTSLPPELKAHSGLTICRLK